MRFVGMKVSQPAVQGELRAVTCAARARIESFEAELRCADPEHSRFRRWSNQSQHQPIAKRTGSAILRRIVHEIQDGRAVASASDLKVQVPVALGIRVMYRADPGVLPQR